MSVAKLRRHCAPGVGRPGPACCGRVLRSMRESHPTERSNVMAIVPSGVTSHSLRPGATTHNPFADTQPWIGCVVGAGWIHPDASRGDVLRSHTSSVVAATNV